jgi:hypothetical protein
MAETVTTGTAMIETTATGTVITGKAMTEITAIGMAMIETDAIEMVMTGTGIVMTGIEIITGMNVRTPIIRVMTAICTTSHVKKMTIKKRIIVQLIPREITGTAEDVKYINQIHL